MCSICSASQAQAAAAAGLGLGALAVIIALSILAGVFLLGLGTWVWLRRLKHKLRRAMPGFIDYAELNLKPSRWELRASRYADLSPTHCHNSRLAMAGWGVPAPAAVVPPGRPPVTSTRLPCQHAMRSADSCRCSVMHLL